MFRDLGHPGEVRAASGRRYGSSDPSYPFDPFDRSATAPSGLTRRIVAYRRGWAVGVVGLFALCFSGRWRIGLDSALFRGVADSLATGAGYTFGGERQTLVYPGLPVLLAGCRRLLGESLVPPLLMMTAAAFLTLWVTYRLLRRHVAPWVAMTVVLGMGLNARFVQQSQELMTDLPFLLGVVVTLWGWSLLAFPQPGSAGRERMAGGTLLLAGLILSATMRPTFWVVAASIVGAAAWRLLGPPERTREVRRAPERSGGRGVAVALLVVSGVTLLWGLIDPREPGVNPFGGEYERTTIAGLGSIGETGLRHAKQAIGRHLTACFFGETMSPFGVVFAGFLALGTVLVGRRLPAWGLLAGGTLAAAVLFSSVPRYFLMALPVWWLAWLTVWSAAARRLPQSWGEWVLDVAIVLVIGVNLSPLARLVSEQRSGDPLAGYRDREALPLAEAVDLIRAHLPPGEKVLGPHGSVLTYLSGRHVAGDAELLRRGTVRDYPRTVEAFAPTVGLFPAWLYDEKDPVLREMLRRNVVVAAEVIARSDGPSGLYLATLQVIPPPGDWRDLPIHRPRAANSGEPGLGVGPPPQ